MPDFLKAKDIIYKEEAYKIVGAAMTVHKQLGCGFLEQVYQEALEIEFNLQGLPNEREAMLTIEYKGKPLQKHYVADFICYDKIILELKAVSKLEGVHESQALNYLKATGYKLGLLVNFGEPSLRYKRLVF